MVIMMMIPPLLDDDDGFDFLDDEDGFDFLDDEDLYTTSCSMESDNRSFLMAVTVLVIFMLLMLLAVAAYSIQPAGGEPSSQANGSFWQPTLQIVVSKLQKWESEILSWIQPPAPEASLPSENSEEIKSLVETGATVEIVEGETIVINNCDNSTRTEMNAERSRKAEYLIEIEGNGKIEGDVYRIIQMALETKYGIQNRQVEERVYTIHFATSPHKKAEHTILWKYTWYLGKITVRFQDGTEQVYTYKVRALLEPETISKEMECEAPTPTLISP